MSGETPHAAYNTPWLRKMKQPCSLLALAQQNCCMCRQHAFLARHNAHLVPGYLVSPSSSPEQLRLQERVSQSLSREGPFQNRMAVKYCMQLLCLGTLHCTPHEHLPSYNCDKTTPLKENVCRAGLTSWP
eukprot:scaffold284069_cov15-Tisochrysis_lutea.AAC.1